MPSARSVLLLDFDTVFGGLLDFDPALAMRFARDPGAWLRTLADLDHETRSRWLVLRCYMDPSNSAVHPFSADLRIGFGSFRDNFVDAGFEVIETIGPAIQVAMDAGDALWVDPLYDEFVIASGRADLAPLLIRLRAAGRHTTLVCPASPVAAMASVADTVVDRDGLRQLLGDELPSNPSAEIGPEPTGYVGRHARPVHPIEVPHPRMPGVSTTSTSTPAGSTDEPGGSTDETDETEGVEPVTEQPALAQRIPQSIPRYDAPRPGVDSSGDWFGRD